MNVFMNHYLQDECLREPPLSSMSSYIFRGHLRWVNRINRDFYLCFSCESHKHVSPTTKFVFNTPKPLRVALDELTISPFVVIDDKLVEVFNGDKNR